MDEKSGGYTSFKQQGVGKLNKKFPISYKNIIAV